MLFVWDSKLTKVNCDLYYLVYKSLFSKHLCDVFVFYLPENYKKKTILCTKYKYLQHHCYLVDIIKLCWWDYNNQHISYELTKFAFRRKSFRCFNMFTQNSNLLHFTSASLANQCAQNMLALCAKQSGKYIIFYVDSHTSNTWNESMLSKSV